MRQRLFNAQLLSNPIKVEISNFLLTWCKNYSFKQQNIAVRQINLNDLWIMNKNYNDKKKIKNYNKKNLKTDLIHIKESMQWKKHFLETRVLDAAVLVNVWKPSDFCDVTNNVHLHTSTQSAFGSRAFHELVGYEQDSQSEVRSYIRTQNLISELLRDVGSC